MDVENDVQRTQKRRRSSILKRSSRSPSRTPLGEKTNEADCEKVSPKKRSRRSLSKRVSFSSAPQVREFQREQAVGVGAGLSTGFPLRENELVQDSAPPQQPYPWLESLMSGSLRLHDQKKEQADVCHNRTIMSGDAMELTLLADDLDLSDTAEDELAQPASTTLCTEADMSMTMCAPGNLSIFVPVAEDSSEMSVNVEEEDNRNPLSPPEPSHMSAEEEAQERARVQAFLQSLQPAQSAPANSREAPVAATQLNNNHFTRILNQSPVSSMMETCPSGGSSPKKQLLENNQGPADFEIQEMSSDQAPQHQSASLLADERENTQPCQAVISPPAQSKSSEGNMMLDTSSPVLSSNTQHANFSGQTQVTSTPLPGHSMNPLTTDLDGVTLPSTISDSTVTVGFKASSTRMPNSNDPTLSRPSKGGCFLRLSSSPIQNDTRVLRGPTPHSELHCSTKSDNASTANEFPSTQSKETVPSPIHERSCAPCKGSTYTVSDQVQGDEHPSVAQDTQTLLSTTKPSHNMLSPQGGICIDVPGRSGSDTSPAWPSPPESVGLGFLSEGDAQPIEDELPFDLVGADSDRISTVTAVGEVNSGRQCFQPEGHISAHACSEIRNSAVVGGQPEQVLYSAEDSPRTVNNESPPVQIISVEGCLPEAAEKWPLRCNLETSVLLPKHREQQSCADELFVAIASKPCQQIIEWGLDNLKEVNQRLEQRIGEHCADEGQCLPPDEAKVQATCFHLIAQVEAYNYQEKLFGQLTENLEQGVAEMEGTLSSVTDHCARLDETLHQVDTEIRAISNQSALFEVNRPLPAQRKAEKALVEKAEKQHTLLQEVDEALKKSEDRRAALCQEKLRLAAAIERLEAQLRSQENYRAEKLAEKEAVSSMVEDAKETWALVQGLQEWDLDELLPHTASLSFFRDSVRFDFKLKPPLSVDVFPEGGLRDTQQVDSFEMSEGPIQTPFEWEAMWFAMGRALFLDAIHPMLPTLKKCQTMSAMIDILNPVALQARLVVDQCYRVSQRHIVEQSVPDRSVDVLFSGTKPLHRFTVTFKLHAGSEEYDASCIVNYGPLNSTTIISSLQTIPRGYEYLWQAVEGIKQLIASRRLPSC